MRFASVLYSRGLYENDLRDVLFYNRVRPKFFASEPASVTFCYALFSFIWMVVSPWRWKMPVYVALIGLGLFAMPGPTLLLMLLLMLPYMLFLGSRRQAGWTRVASWSSPASRGCSLAAFVVLAPVAVSRAARRDHIGQRSQFLLPGAGPAMAGVGIMEHYPLPAAASREPFIESEVTNLYVRSTRLFRRLADRLAGDRAADQLFLAALDLPRNCLGPDHHCRADGLAGRAGRAEPGLLLDGVGDPGAGLGRLCRADLLGGVVPRRRRRGAASALRATRGNVPCRGRKVRRDRLAKKFASEVNKAAAALPREYPIRLSKQLKTSALTPGGRGMEKRSRVADRPRGSRRAN